SWRRDRSLRCIPWHRPTTLVWSSCNSHHLVEFLFDVETNDEWLSWVASVTLRQLARRASSGMKLRENEGFMPWHKSCSLPYDGGLLRKVARQECKGEDERWKKPR